MQDTHGHDVLCVSPHACSYLLIMAILWYKEMLTLQTDIRAVSSFEYVTQTPELSNKVIPTVNCHGC